MEWIGRLDARLRKRLYTAGLIEQPEEDKAAGEQEAVVRLDAFLQAYIDGRTDVKERTRINLGQARRNLVRFFGADKPLADIAPGDADEFRRDVMARLAENTARRHCGRAKQFFRAAVRKRLIQENPFADRKGCGVKANPSRMFFVTHDVAQKVLDACPDAQWRLLFALSRYGGLRCPAEIVALHWADVDWEHDKITVHVPKLEHLEGHETRAIPIFPELRPYLEEVWEQAEPGMESEMGDSFQVSGANNLIDKKEPCRSRNSRRGCACDDADRREIESQKCARNSGNCGKKINMPRSGKRRTKPRRQTPTPGKTCHAQRQRNQECQGNRC